MSNATRTGHVGICTEFTFVGKALLQDQEMTIDQMIEYSKKWPKVYHRYSDKNGYVTWAKN